MAQPRRRFRVAMVAACPFPLAHGTPARIYRVAESLDSLGHEVRVVTYHLGDDRPQMPFAVHRTGPITGYHKLSPGPSSRKVLPPSLSGHHVYAT